MYLQPVRNANSANVRMLKCQVRCVKYFVTTEPPFVFCWRAVLIPVLL